MKEWIIAGLLFLCSVSTTWAFKIVSPIAGAKVEAGSTIKVKVDPEDTGGLVGVFFTTSGNGIGGDFVALPPYEWSFT